MFSPRSVFRCSIVLFAAVLFLGCASMPKETDRIELLKVKANEYWKLRFEDKYEDTYKMEDQKGLPAFEAYRTQASLIKKFKLESYSIDKVDVEGDKGHVSVGINFYMKFPEGIKAFRQALYEEWIFRDGQWLHRFPTE